MEATAEGHPPQVFDLPPGTRYVIRPPHVIAPEAAVGISDRLVGDPRTLLFAEPGWTVHVVPAIEPQQGRRLVLMDEDLFDHLALRTDDGCRIAVTWGDPDAAGFYSPTFTRTDDCLVATGQVQ